MDKVSTFFIESPKQISTNTSHDYVIIYSLSSFFMKKKWSISGTKNKILGFTLLEMIIAMTSFFVLLTIVLNIYTKMIKLKYTIQAKTNIIQDSYYTIEKINLLLKDYTIDYEEYFNRKNVGCNFYTEPFTRDVSTDGYCNRFTAYGNNSYVDQIQLAQRKIYFCSSTSDETNPRRVIKNENVQEGSGCLSTGRQSFGQYQWQFRDVKSDVDGLLWAWNDDDDENVMKGPSAIDDETNVKELYLISQDGKSRILIRRTLIESGDWNGDGIISGDSEKLYTLQILKLKGFDAGDNHDFDANDYSWVYDGKIDTRACDYGQGFICWWSWVGNIKNPTYMEYQLPLHQDDGRVNIFQKNITISDRNIIVYPRKNPHYALAENSIQINPYFTINFTSKLYGKIRQKRLGGQNINTFKFEIQTTFNTKNFYTK